MRTIIQIILSRQIPLFFVPFFRSLFFGFSLSLRSRLGDALVEERNFAGEVCLIEPFTLP